MSVAWFNDQIVINLELVIFAVSSTSLLGFPTHF